MNDVIKISPSGSDFGVNLNWVRNCVISGEIVPMCIL